MSYGEIFNTDEPEPWPSAEDVPVLDECSTCGYTHAYWSNEARCEECFTHWEEELSKMDTDAQFDYTPIDTEQAWEYLQSKGVPNLDIERLGKDKVTLVELLAEFANGVMLGRDGERA